MPAIGTPVQVLGAEHEAVSAPTVAAHAGSLSYEVTCRFGARLPRVFRGG